MGDNGRQWETTGDKTISEPKKPTTPTNTKAARSQVALRTPTVNCLGKNININSDQSIRKHEQQFVTTMKTPFFGLLACYACYACCDTLASNRSVQDTVRFWISTAQRQSPSTPMLKFVGDAAQAALDLFDSRCLQHFAFRKQQDLCERLPFWKSSVLHS